MNMQKVDWNQYYQNTPDNHIPWNKTGKYLFDYFFSKYTLPEGKILDIGCGKGLKVKYLQTLGYTAYGFDLSGVAVRQANSANIFIGDIEKIEKIDQIKNTHFALILDLLASQFVLDRSHYLHTIEKILLPNGYFILSQFYPTTTMIPQIKDIAKTAEEIKNEFEKFEVIEIMNNKDPKKPAATYIMKLRSTKA